MFSVLSDSSIFEKHFVPILRKPKQLKIFEAYKGMYHCQHLPAYAKFLVQHHLADYAKAQIVLGMKMNLPLLAMLTSRYSEEQLVQISIESSREYLTSLADNNVIGQLTTSMDKWLKDRLEVVGKLEIVAQDITVINFVRSQSMKKFVPLYTNDMNHAVAIGGEIDTIMLGSNTTAVDIYIDILKDKINEQSNLATKVIEASPAVTFLFDTVNNKQIFVSGNVEEVMGYTPEEVMVLGDRLLTELTHPEDLHVLVEHINSVLRENSNTTKQLEYRFRHKDGRYRWLRTYEVIFRRDANGNPLEILGKTFEITHEKEIALALAKRERQLLEAQEIAQIGSYEWNMVENESNNTAEVYRIFGLNKDQRYEEFLTHVHKDDVQKVKDAITQSYTTGAYECEYRYLKNGNEKVVWSLGKVEFKDGAPIRMVGTVQDVTAIKRIERELLVKSRELEDTNESLRQFAYVASHDMKEPLRKIMMFSDLVMNSEKGKISEGSLSKLQKMQNAGRSLYRMVEDILSFSLLEAKENKIVTDLNVVVKEVEDLLEESLKEKQAKLICGNLPPASIIPSQFRQLFQNLISNSLKFARNNVPPVIQINASITTLPIFEMPVAAESYLEIRIEDNGIGFPADAAERIFELFSRIHAKSEYEGTGLGLSISRRIVQNHGGVIKAIPGKDDGAVFIIVIPYH